MSSVSVSPLVWSEPLPMWIITFVDDFCRVEEPCDGGATVAESEWAIVAQLEATFFMVLLDGLCNWIWKGLEEAGMQELPEPPIMFRSEPRFNSIPGCGIPYNQEGHLVRLCTFI